MELRRVAGDRIRQHLYYPLLHCTNRDIEISPVELNEGEKDFVQDLRRFYDSNKTFFAEREMYLLRNLSRGRGIGFFEAGNFHPDFILWLLVGSRQYITFVDPKGIRNLEGRSDPKIAFHKTIKELEVRLGAPRDTRIFYCGEHSSCTGEVVVGRNDKGRV